MRRQPPPGPSLRSDVDATVLESIEAFVSHGDKRRRWFCSLPVFCCGSRHVSTAHASPTASIRRRSSGTIVFHSEQDMGTDVSSPPQVVVTKK